MARRPRIDHPGGIHHVMNRGVDRDRVFFGDIDRVEFGRRLAEIHVRFEVQTIAYCLMPNHYHVLLHAPRGDLSRAMHHLAITYTRHTNDRVGRDGPLFRGRYHSIPVTTDAYLMCAARYIHRNPLALAGIDRPDRYRWSSYRTYLGLRAPPPFLATGLLMGLCGDQPQAIAEFTERESAFEATKLDLSTALQLADLAQATADTEADDETDIRITGRLVLTLLIDRLEEGPLRDQILRHLAFPSDSARRTALYRARQLAGHPVLAAVLGPSLLVSDTRSDAEVRLG